MRTVSFFGLVVACGLLAFSLTATVFLPGTKAYAMGGEPAAPKVDCRKKKNKKKPECKKKRKSELTDDELYQAGYWLVRWGRYEDALAQFMQIREQDAPRVLNYLGFTTRKLGRVDQALEYYRRALALDPNYTLARAYMGEAFLGQGQLDAAKGQLQEIGRRCGEACVEFVQLASQIRDFETTGRFTPQAFSQQHRTAG